MLCGEQTGVYTVFNILNDLGFRLIRMTSCNHINMSQTQNTAKRGFFVSITKHYIIVMKDLNGYDLLMYQWLTFAHCLE